MALFRIRSHKSRGFTVIEMMVAVVISIILITVAVGGFGGSFARKRTDGVATGLIADMQYARSESVSRNRPVRLTFGTNCYVIHTVVGTTSCNRANTPVVTLGTAGGFTAVNIKAVTLPADSDVTVTRQPSAAPVTFYEFNPVNGRASVGGGSAIGDTSVLLGSNRGAWQLRVGAALTGRVDVCSPSSTMPGYAAC